MGTVTARSVGASTHPREGKALVKSRRLHEVESFVSHERLTITRQSVVDEMPVITQLVGESQYEEVARLAQDRRRTLLRGRPESEDTSCRLGKSITRARPQRRTPGSRARTA